MNKKDRILLNVVDEEFYQEKCNNWHSNGMVMMNYHNRSSAGYQFSVGRKDHQLVKQLKIKCAIHNKWMRDACIKHNWTMERSWQTLKRVTCMARGPRAKHAKALGYYPRAFDQNLPHKFAQYFDIYYIDDTHNTWMFNNRQEDKIAAQQLENELAEILASEVDNVAAKAKIITKIKELRKGDK